MTSATSPENWMSLAPTVSSTRSRLRPALSLRAFSRASRSNATCGGTLPAQRPVSGHSLAPCEPNIPPMIEAPLQASGRNVTATRRFSIASAARCASDSCRASGGRRPTSSARHAASSRRSAAAPGPAGLSSHAFAAPIALAARPEIFAAHRAEEAAEAEALVGQRDGAVGIAFARRDRVAQPRDQQVAHLDFGRNAFDGVVRPGDADRRDRGLAVAAGAAVPPRRRRR